MSKRTSRSRLPNRNSASAFAELRLADARRPDEEERAERLLRVVQPRLEHRDQVDHASRSPRAGRARAHSKCSRTSRESGAARRRRGARAACRTAAREAAGDGGRGRVARRRPRARARRPRAAGSPCRGSCGTARSVRSARPPRRRHPGRSAGTRRRRGAPPRPRRSRAPRHSPARARRRGGTRRRSSARCSSAGGELLRRRLADDRDVAALDVRAEVTRHVVVAPRPAPRVDDPDRRAHDDHGLRVCRASLDQPPRALLPLPGVDRAGDQLVRRDAARRFRSVERRRRLAGGDRPRELVDERGLADVRRADESTLDRPGAASVSSTRWTSSSRRSIRPRSPRVRSTPSSSRIEGSVSRLDAERRAVVDRAPPASASISSVQAASRRGSSAFRTADAVHERMRTRRPAAPPSRRGSRGRRPRRAARSSAAPARRRRRPARPRATRRITTTPRVIARARRPCRRPDVERNTEQVASGAAANGSLSTGSRLSSSRLERRLHVLRPPRRRSRPDTRGPGTERASRPPARAGDSRTCNAT